MHLNNIKLKIGVVVILYYPTNNDLKLIEKYKLSFSNILLFDNTPLSDINYSFSKPFEHIVNGDNLGMSKALEYAISWADNLRLDYLLTMDQDSDFPIDEIEKLFDCIADSSKQIAIFCPNYRKKYLNKENNIVISKPKISTEKNEFVTRCMTSGSVMNINIAKDLLPLDNLFIGMVDDDISYMLVLKGEKILMCGNSVFVQQVGKQAKMGIFRRFFHANILSVQRYYYMGRNSRYLIKKYSKYPSIIKSILIIRIRIILNIILCEEKKYQKIKSWLEGTKKWKVLLK